MRKRIAVIKPCLVASSTKIVSTKYDHFHRISSERKSSNEVSIRNIDKLFKPTLS